MHIEYYCLKYNKSEEEIVNFGEEMEIIKCLRYETVDY